MPSTFEQLLDTILSTYPALWGISRAHFTILPAQSEKPQSHGHAATKFYRKNKRCTHTQVLKCIGDMLPRWLDYLFGYSKNQLFLKSGKMGSYILGYLLAI